MKNAISALRPLRRPRLVLTALLSLLFLVLAALAAAPASASSETGEPGYWSETVDESGQTVKIFTYTRDIVPRELNQAPMDGYAGGDALPIAGSDTAEKRLAAQPSAESTETGFPVPLVLPAGVGFAFLALLAFALYKAS